MCYMAITFTEGPEVHTGQLTLYKVLTLMALGHLVVNLYCKH